MATPSKNDTSITLDVLAKRMVKMLDHPAVGDMTRQSLKLRLEHPIGTMAEAIIADFKVLADHLVSEVQVCDKCGNEIHFDRYATYPQAKVDLPENFGKPAMLEQVWQFDPGEDEGSEALSNNNGSGNTTLPMPSPDLGEGKEK